MMKTVVVCKKDLKTGCVVVTPSERRERIQKINSYPDSLPQPQARRKKKLIITFSIIGGVALFIVFVICSALWGLNSKKDSEEYRVAYEYVIESQEFERNGANEDKLRFTQYSKETVYGKEDNGKYKSTVAIGFSYGFFDSFVVICHDDGDGNWYVCTDCTEFD